MSIAWSNISLNASIEWGSISSYVRKHVMKFEIHVSLGFMHEYD